MKSTRSLCFSGKGLVNGDNLTYIHDNAIEQVIVFTDGSLDAYDQIQKYDYNSLPPSVRRVGFGRLPMYEVRVVRTGGDISFPHYVINEETYRQWLCSEVAGRFITINIRDISTASSTKVELETKQTETVCFIAYNLWDAMLIAEERLSFPASIIDGLSAHTYHLTRETMHIEKLREELGVSSLEYVRSLDQLSVEVGGDIFTVKLSILNALYGELILPIFNSIYGRRYRIEVTVSGATGDLSTPTEMSYGDLGRLVHELETFAKKRLIHEHDPIATDDLIAFAKKVVVNDASCFWPGQNQSIFDAIKDHFSDFVRCDPARDQEYPSDTPTTIEHDAVFPA
jgi:hypothetical protein